MSGTDLSIVVPVFKNRATLEALFDRVRTVPGQVSFEIIFVNDDCPQGSLQILHHLAEQDPRVRLVANSRNLGQNRAILEGLKHASGEIVVTMDADLQDPPEAIPMLIQKLKEGEYGAVFAGRRGRYEGMGRMMTSRIYKHALSLLTGLPPDAGLFVAMNRAMVNRVLSFSADKPSVVAMIGCSGLPVTSIPVERSSRAEGESAYKSGMRITIAFNALLWVTKTKLHRKHHQIQS